MCQGRRYKPTLILVPANAVTVWKSELKSFPGFGVRYFYGNARSADVFEKHHYLGTNVKHLLASMRMGACPLRDGFYDIDIGVGEDDHGCLY